MHEEYLETQDYPIDDAFLKEIYQYWREKGYASLVLSRAFNLAQVGFVLVFATLLITCVNWIDLFQATSVEQTELSSALECQSIHPIWMGFLVVACFGWLFMFWRFLTTAVSKLEVKRFYRDTLHIEESQLQTITWDRVVEVMISRVGRLNYDCRTATAEEIAQRILRRENYYVAMMNVKDPVIDFDLNFPCIGKINLITKATEWGLSRSLDSFIFDEHGVQSVIRTSRTDDLAIPLRRRFRIIGIIGLLLAPVIIVYVMMYALFRYGEEIRNRPSTILSSRQWNRRTKWVFRECNEAPHVLEKRLNLSHRSAMQYVNQFRSSIMVIVARFMTFVLGSFLIVILLIGLVSDDAVFNTDIGGKSLLWFATVFGALVVVFRGLIPDANAVFNPWKPMEQVQQHLRGPSGWTSNANALKTLDSFTLFFEYRPVVFIREIAGVLLAPLLFLFVLPGCAENIIRFVKECTTQKDTVGLICTAADFSNRESLRRHTGTSFGDDGEEEEFLIDGGRYQLINGKIENSVVGFKQSHPSWSPAHLDVEQSSSSSSITVAQALGAHLGQSTILRPSSPHDGGDREGIV